METSYETKTTEKDLFIKMMLTAWTSQNKRVNELLESITDEQLQKETAPGRNTGVYLLGHLTATSDAMLPLFGLGEKLYPQLESIFLTNPDKSGLEKPPVAELRKYWTHVGEALLQRLQQMTMAAWFERHNAVSAEDFVKEPHRNKLNVLISRTTHMGYHFGQMIYLKPKK